MRRDHPVEHHHRRIRQRAHAIHWGLWPLALAAPLAWLYFALGACEDAETGLRMELCRWGELVPLLPALTGLIVSGLIVWELAHLGAHHKQAPRVRLHHAGHGYRSLDARHKRHVHLAWAQALLVAAALVAWLIYLRQSVQ